MSPQIKTAYGILLVFLLFALAHTCFGQAQLVQSFIEQNSTGNRQFGYSVSGAGDLNNDGYDDIIIGTYRYYLNYSRAYIFYGGSTMDNTADVTITRGFESFGLSVSGAGDVNNDGFDDAIIGAPSYDNGTGRAYIYFGSSSMDTTADVVLTGHGTYFYFGSSVSGAGDVNNDGYDDVIVGAYGAGSNNGSSYIYYGGSSMDTIADVAPAGPTGTNYFGCSVSGAGDVNNDGFDDVIVGGYGKDSYTGFAIIFYGGNPMNKDRDITLNGLATNDFFGFSVSNAGDVNNDNFDDVIVGAYGTNTNTGNAYIYYGGNPMNNTADVTMTGSGTNNYFGYSVSDAGNVNTDNYDDVIVGVYGFSTTGCAYIYCGGNPMNNTYDLRLVNESAGSNFGWSVSGAGDVNNDGYDDVITGAPGSIGSVYICGGGNPMEDSYLLTIRGEETDNAFGYSVSGAGDVNNDGYDDVIIGALQYGEYNYAGRAYIYYGGNPMDNTADVTITGWENEFYGDQLGYSVSGAGDVNNDGYDDVIIGVPYSILGTGCAYIYHGGNPMDNTYDVRLISEASGSNFGTSVSDAGDVNNDGYDDVIVGAYGYNSNTGRAYIYHGGSPMDTLADVIMNGEGINNRFGYSVSGAGDMNKNGYDDVIIGAHWYNTNMGRAYVYFDGSEMNIALTGETGSMFGYSVSGAGDVNKDGSSDVIVGAIGYASYTGRAYIYYGGIPINSVVDVTLTGEAVGDYFGSSVSGAGDVNNDGYDDVVVGTTYVYATHIPPGNAYIYYGGSPMNTIADVTITGEGIYNYFGSSVSCAGDVNNDGCSDVIIGACLYPLNGKTYIYSDPGAPVPVELTTFTAEANSGNVQLHWNTATEVNNYGFEVERRRVSNELRLASNWEKVGFMAGVGTSNAPHEYTYSDAHLSPGRYAYRLKQIDQSGIFKYSQTVEVEIGGVPKLFMLNQNYPNPFNPTTTFEFTIAQDSKVMLKIFDILGREIATLVDEEMKSGVLHQVRFDASKLSSGIYFSCLESNGKKQVRKLMLMK